MRGKTFLRGRDKGVANIARKRNFVPTIQILVERRQGEAANFVNDFFLIILDEINDGFLLRNEFLKIRVDFVQDLFANDDVFSQRGCRHWLQFVSESINNIDGDLDFVGGVFDVVDINKNFAALNVDMIVFL